MALRGVEATTTHQQDPRMRELVLTIELERDFSFFNRPSCACPTFSIVEHLLCPINVSHLFSNNFQAIQLSDQELEAEQLLASCQNRYRRGAE